jgi:hypothetical protein
MRTTGPLSRRGFSLLLALGLSLSLVPVTISAQSATSCAPGQTPRYVFGFANLKAAMGAPMGEPTTCEFADPNGTGDVHQRTSTGLAFWRKSTNTPTFTNGFTHWALTNEGLVAWTGDSIDPPGTVLPPATATPTAQPTSAPTVVAPTATPAVSAPLPTATASGPRIYRGRAKDLTSLNGNPTCWALDRDSVGSLPEGADHTNTSYYRPLTAPGCLDPQRTLQLRLTATVYADPAVALAAFIKAVDNLPTGMSRESAPEDVGALSSAWDAHGADSHTLTVSSVIDNVRVEATLDTSVTRQTPKDMAQFLRPMISAVKRLRS